LHLDAGGYVFEMPWGTLRSPNLTPDSETGIGDWTREFFIENFKVWDVPESEYRRVEPGDVNTVMPWLMYAKMTEEDLGAIYDYLRTVEPGRMPSRLIRRRIPYPVTRNGDVVST
jgi:hypothetical protein